jgi:hypothetical protein
VVLPEPGGACKTTVPDVARAWSSSVSIASTGSCGTESDMVKHFDIIFRKSLVLDGLGALFIETVVRGEFVGQNGLFGLINF